MSVVLCKRCDVIFDEADDPRCTNVTDPMLGTPVILCAHCRVALGYEQTRKQSDTNFEKKRKLG